MKSSHFLAIDLGAESGRTVLGKLNNGRLAITETYRFPIAPVQLPNGLYWDLLRLWTEIKTGITATLKDGLQLDSLGVDTWGVDFALLDKNGALLGNPYHYRDSRTDGMLEEAFKRMPRADIFFSTGIQFMQINTLCQLLAMSRQQSPLLEVAKTFVTIPDLFNFWLSGEITNEFTNATTTQCLDPSTRQWAANVLYAMEIPTHLFRPVTEPGTQLGTLLKPVADETGASGVRIVAPACHDTGSAVVAIPAPNQDFAWISSGTWSILGAEVRQPCLTGKALEYNFTNEGGVFGTWRLSKNVMGLWLLQECRWAWAHQGDVLSYDEISQLVLGAKPFLAVIDPDDNRFLHPGNMAERIQSYCAETNQTVPQTKGEVVRVALESIALKYRWVLERLEELANTQFASIYIVGGGTKNRLLNQFTAEATRRVIVTGPVEATAIGNILMQAIGLKQLKTIAEARAIVRASFEGEEYHPAFENGWDNSFAKLLRLLEGTRLEK